MELHYFLRLTRSPKHSLSRQVNLVSEMFGNLRQWSRLKLLSTLFQFIFALAIFSTTNGVYIFDYLMAVHKYLCIVQNKVKQLMKSFNTFTLKPRQNPQQPTKLLSIYGIRTYHTKLFLDQLTNGNRIILMQIQPLRCKHVHTPKNQRLR